MKPQKRLYLFVKHLKTNPCVSWQERQFCAHTLRDQNDLLKKFHKKLKDAYEKINRLMHKKSVLNTRFKPTDLAPLVKINPQKRLYLFIKYLEKNFWPCAQERRLIINALLQQITDLVYQQVMEEQKIIGCALPPLLCDFAQQEPCIDSQHSISQKQDSHIMACMDLACTLVIMTIALPIFMSWAITIPFCFEKNTTLPIIENGSFSI